MTSPDPELPRRASIYLDERHLRYLLNLPDDVSIMATVADPLTNSVTLTVTGAPCPEVMLSAMPPIVYAKAQHRVDGENPPRPEWDWEATREAWAGSIRGRSA